MTAQTIENGGSKARPSETFLEHIRNLTFSVMLSSREVLKRSKSAYDKMVFAPG